MKKPRVLTLVIIVIVGIAFLLGLNFYFYKKPGIPVNQVVVTSNNSIKQIVGGKLPPDMPKDIILAKDATVVSSYSAVPNDTQTQSTVIYKTSQNIVLLNFDYRNYFAKNGWALQVEKTAGTSTSIQVYSIDKKPLTLVKPNDGKTLLISASKSTDEADQWLVSITLLAYRK